MERWLPRLTEDAAPLSPYRVVWELMQVVDRERTVVTHDAGHPRDQIVPFYETIVPRGYLGWGKSTQLGTGLGLAMGARLARPDRLAVNVMGDAAFGMVGMDFETAVRSRLPILTIVLNNGLMGGYTEWMPEAVAAMRRTAWAAAMPTWRRRSAATPSGSTVPRSCGPHSSAASPPSPQGRPRCARSQPTRRTRWHSR